MAKSKAKIAVWKHALGGWGWVLQDTKGKMVGCLHYSDFDTKKAALNHVQRIKRLMSEAEVVINEK